MPSKTGKVDWKFSEDLEHHYPTLKERLPSPGKSFRFVEWSEKSVYVLPKNDGTKLIKLYGDNQAFSLFPLAGLYLESPWTYVDLTIEVNE